MQANGSRPLAPAPHTSNASNEASGSTPDPSASGQVSGIKRASTACRSCKQIKRKCDQNQPCSNCRKSNTRCVYNEAEDGRRKAARKRTVESLELKRDALDSILESLRTSDEVHVQELINLVRAHAPLEDIVQYASSHAEDFTGKQVQDIRNVVHGQPRKTVLSVHDLCETPLVRVPADPWTNVTRDSEFVSHLMSIYFTWFHIAYPILDKQLFLRDMGAAELDCHFCSPLLVNAILAMACHFSDHPRACQIPSDASTRGKHFLDEAMRLWSEQEGKLNMVNIQAVAILAVLSTLVGKDRLSFSYVQQANAMQQELVFKSSQAETRGTHVMSPEMKRSQTLTSWTIFLLTAGFGAAFMKQPSSTSAFAEMKLSSEPVLERNLNWLPYPRQSPEIIIPFDDLFRAQCSLHQIGVEIQRLHFGDNVVRQNQDVTSIEQKLQDWELNLLESLSLRNDPTVPMQPPILDLHLTYHWFCNMLFNFIRSPPSPTKSALGSKVTDQDHARARTIESTKAIADLCRRFAQDFGLKQFTVWMPQACVSAAYSLIEELSDIVNGPIVQDIFHELCLVLVAASQRWLVMKGHVRMLVVTAEEKGHTLQPKTKQLLNFVALDKWGEQDHLQFASASYPNYALAKEEDPRLTGMGDLLERWASFRTHEEKEEAIVENAHALASGFKPSSDYE